MSNVGFIGLGIMGKPMALNLIKGGHTLFLNSRSGVPKEVTLRGVYRFVGLSREETKEVEAGDLCGIYGVENIEIGDTLAALERPEAMPVIAIDEPTMTIVMRVNDSPFAGRDGGKFLTSRHLRERLEKELRVNVALRVEPGDGADSFKLSGRGVMHLGFLLETMRREGYEFAVAKPQVLFKTVDGDKHEPIEYLTVDAPSARDSSDGRRGRAGARPTCRTRGHRGLGYRRRQPRDRARWGDGVHWR
jgi:GTP-binding protein